jgi:hypothetical protein
MGLRANQLISLAQRSHRHGSDRPCAAPVRGAQAAVAAARQRAPTRAAAAVGQPSERGNRSADRPCRSQEPGAADPRGDSVRGRRGEAHHPRHGLRLPAALARTSPHNMHPQRPLDLPRTSDSAPAQGARGASGCSGSRLSSSPRCASANPAQTTTTSVTSQRVMSDTAPRLCPRSAAADSRAGLTGSPS